MPIVLVCGYRRTGKDTLYQKLSGQTDKYRWNIYQSPEKDPIIFPKDGKYSQVAFADELKKEASQKYGIPLFVEDSEKDVSKFVHYESGELVSARDIYIEWGKIQRQNDPNYWCRLALSAYQPSDSNWHIITDWRFTNEEEYVQSHCDVMITCRLYRPDVSIPPMEIESEHQLDSVKTNILMLPPKIEIKDILSLFPQYSDYVLTGTI